jgi:hypothetical protein
MATERNLRYYEEFLKFITAKRDLWFALPMEAAQWWRDRASSEVVQVNGSASFITGVAKERGRVCWATLEHGRVRYLC